jgi:alkanesulfonate monooxygenase SsuD/methylene tetrahydromethanopterin reductase-like flavin-dependent oxidoreductase (luciferase family)/predicted kinase
MADAVSIPDPAVVVLIGPTGSGKSTWAASRYREQEVVSSDALRAVVGSGEHDLDASGDAFDVLDQIVAARLRRGLTTVIDTLGLESRRRLGYLAAARAAGLPAVAVLSDTEQAVCRSRNASRDRPVPASALDQQVRAMRTVIDGIADEGWDVVVRFGDDARPEASHVAGTREAVRSQRDSPVAFEFVLQISQFPWGEDPTGWLSAVAAAAESAGFAGVALMDHLIQIPQVGRAWDPIPEPLVTLGLLAGRTSRLRLGTLVSPVTFRPAGVLAKAIATLDVLSGGRAFCGVGAGWWDREHAAFAVPFPPAGSRLDALETTIETMRALWSKGTKAYDGDRVSLPETTCYPRPVGEIPIVVGGNGERRTLRIAARLADACNLPSAVNTLERKIAVLRRCCDEVGRDRSEVDITVLDIPIVGRDRDAVATVVETLRGRTPAATFARTHHAGTIDDQVGRYRMLAERGVRTAFVALPDLAGPEQLETFAPIVAAFSSA